MNYYTGLILLTSCVITYASFCGDTLVPYSLEILPSGQPVLGCARPTCFGWNPDGTPLAIKSSFFRINQNPDGFTRDDPTFIPPFDISDPRVYPTQKAKCEAVYESTSCSSETQWVGGIVPLLNVSSSPSAYICCEYEPLKLSTDRGIATVSGGQIAIGGEVFDEGKQFAFDYISNIEKQFNSNGTVSYEVSIRRFPCLAAHDLGSENPSIQNSESVIQNLNDIEVEKVLAHDVPNVKVDTQPIPLENVNPQISNYPVPHQLPAPIPAQYVVGSAPVAPQQGYVQPPLPSYAQAPAPAPAPYVPQYGYGYAQPQLQLYYCFSEDDQVNLIDGSIKRMDELSTDDWVAAVGKDGIEFVPVTYWIHKDPEQIAQFRKIRLEDGTELKLTDEHHIYKAECSVSKTVKSDEVNKISVYARDVVAGDCLYKIEKETITLVKVENVSIVTEKGIYSPMTASGNIIVNNIHTSCHTVVNSHPLQNTLFSYVDDLNNFVSSIFGFSEKRDIPIGIGIIVQLVEFILPKQFI